MKLGEHAPVGSSVAERVLKCPGSVRLAALAPPRPLTPEIKAGTAEHEVIRLCMNFGYEPHDFVSRIVKGVEIEPEMADTVAPFVDRARGYQASGAKVFIEHRFSLAEFDAWLWGTCDLLAYWPATRHMKVDDYKAGVGKYVDHRRNAQGLYLLCGGMFALGKPIKTLQVGIDQPRYWGGTERYREFDSTPEELWDFLGDLVDAVELSRKPDAPLCVGDHCDFCPARGGCPAFFDFVLKSAGSDLEPNTGQLMEPLEPGLLTPDELGQRLDMAHIVASWPKAVRAFAHGEMLRGRIATGYQAEKKFGHRKWKDPRLAATQAVRVYQGVITEEKMYSPAKVISPAQFERLVGKPGAKDFLDTHVTRPESIALAKIGGEGKAIGIGADAEFEPIGDLTSEQD